MGLLAGAFLFGKLVGAYSTGDERDWTTIWLWPCVTAAVILVLFCVLFRDRLPAGERAASATDESTGETSAEGLG